MASTDTARGRTRAAVRARQALLAVVGAALTLLMVFLGMWQMQVFESQKQLTTEQRAAQPPVPLLDNLRDGSTIPTYGRRVTVRGTYLAGRQVLVGTSTPRRVVTALRTTDGRTLAVVRGTTTAATAPAPAAGPQDLSGIMLPQEASVADPAPTGVEPSLRLDQLAQEWPAPLLDGYLTLDAALQRSPGLGVATAQIPDTGGGKVRNQGYALQWWAFAGFTAVATVAGVRGLGRRATTDD